MPQTKRLQKRRSESEWRNLLEEQQQSGLTQRVFCDQKGIVLSSFHYWKRRLSIVTMAEPSSNPEWLALPAALTQKSHASWEIELDLGNGVCLRLRQQ